jgi:molecular chaperone DnaK (HSP70)
VAEGTLTQLAVSNDSMLGGRDFDHAMYDLCRRRIDSTYGAEALADPVSKHRLLRECEMMKIELNKSPKLE